MPDEEHILEVEGKVETTEGGDSSMPAITFGGNQGGPSDQSGSASAAPAATPAPSSPPAQPQQPQQTQPYQYQPTYGQSYPPSPYAAQPSVPTYVSISRALSSYLWILAFIGGILALIGVALSIGSDNYDIRNAGRVMSTLGSLIIGLPMIIAGIYNDSANEHVRYGMIMGGAILIMAMAFF